MFYCRLICFGSMLSSNPHMMELIVPLPFSGGEQALAETIASEMELHTEMVTISMHAAHCI